MHAKPSLAYKDITHGKIEIRAPPSRKELRAIQAKKAEAANKEKLLRRQLMLEAA